MRAAVHHADHGALVWAYLHRIRDALQDGDVARADADLDRARPVAHATRRSFYRWFLMVAEAGRAAFAGRLEEAERMTEEALALNRRHGDDCFQEYTVARLVLARLRWRPHDADARPAARVRRPLSAPAGVGGDARVAGVGARRRRGGAPRRGAAARATTSPRSCARRTSCPRRSASPRPRRAPASRGRSSGCTSCWCRTPRANPVLEHLWAVWGPAARGLALLAAADDRPRDAAAHFADALRLADAWGAPGWALRTIGDWLATGVPRPDRGGAGQPRAAAGARARAAGRGGADRRRGSDHHAVALDHGLRRVVEAHARVALVAPVGAPARAQQEVVGAVAVTARRRGCR